MSDDDSRILPVRGRVPGYIVSDEWIFAPMCVFSWPSADHAQGRERTARDEARTPQAPREEDEYVVSGPNLVRAGSSSKDDADAG